MKYHYYVVHVAAETNEEKLLGPFSSEKIRENAIQKLRQKANANLRNWRVRSRFYPANIADDILSEVIGDTQEAA